MTHEPNPYADMIFVDIDDVDEDILAEMLERGLQRQLPEIVAVERQGRKFRPSDLPPSSLTVYTDCYDAGVSKLK